MNEIAAIVEGQTEQTFIRDVLAEHLGQWGTSIWARLPGKTGRQGGVKKWEVARSDIIRTLKERRYCTTMFDYYAMPNDWPGRAEATKLPYQERGPHVETAIVEHLSGYLGESFDRRQFIPYVQVHEFEALLFADVNALTETLVGLAPHLPSRPPLVDRFSKILNEVGDPEAIDDGFETCPSRRIMSIIKGYRKVAFGPIVAKKIGLQVLRNQCKHFGDWVSRLEQVAQSTSNQ